MPEPKPTRESLSKTPSWIMLGFVIGCIVALTVKRQVEGGEKTDRPSKPPVEQVASPPPEPAPTSSRISLSDMEAIFDQWKGNAIWTHDITEVAFWDATTQQYSGFVEVLRNGDDYFFRTISRLTRPMVEEGIPSNMPIRFTETEAMRAQRRARFMIPPH